ncbi:single-stranded DNA-binding protein [Desulfitobacterium sp.]|uniref:single-stranded DNA-binding protein n=1 Tax=Desulfitobacterium sp. TaxID=49981 RepID=UPI002B7F3885|nr:single-stranded DNA-binding protein [Desulfitobacterium sp.]HVJ49134.1 single-stranded DNA-binding protein [Desulfitobacterium sp.]
MLNRVVLIGRLTKDPELRYTPSGVAVATFTLAVDRNFKNSNGERETDFVPCVVYRQLAELCANFLSKGKLASADGRLQIRSYEGQDGQRRWVTEVIAENVQFLSPKENGNSGSGTVGNASDVGTYGHEVSLDDDIPF